MKLIHTQKRNRKRTRIAAIGLAVVLCMASMPGYAAEPAQGNSETVYVLADADGNVKEEMASVRMEKADGSVSATEPVTLTDSEELPIEVTIRYELNGRKVSSEELAGAGGHLRMTINYTNKQKKVTQVDGKKTTLYQPFVVITAVVLNQENAANVTVSNGEVLHVGSTCIAFGTAFPGLSDSLQLDDLTDLDGEEVELDIPEQVEIEADITDFSMTTCATFYDNSLLADLDLTGLDSISDLQDSMKELGDASTQLVDGSSRLADGVDQIAAGSTQINDGAATLSDGAAELSDGTQTLSDGAARIRDGLGKLQTQVSDLPDSTAALYKGAQTLQSALPAVAEAAEGISGGASTISGVAAQLDGGIEQVEKGLNDNVSQLNSSLKSAAGSLETAAGYNTNAADLITGVIQSLDAEEDAKEIGLLNQALQCIGAGSQYVNGVSGALSATSLDTTDAINTLETIRRGIGKISAGAVSGDAANPGIKEGADGIVAGINTILTGNSGNNLEALTEGLGLLAKASPDLVSGIGELKEGQDQLASGAQDAADGAAQLSGGAATLSNGIATLNDGISQLPDGTKALRDGIIKFDEEGIQKLASLSDKELSGIVERAKALQAYSKEYTSFSDTVNVSTDSVRFVIRTDSIGK